KAHAKDTAAGLDHPTDGVGQLDLSALARWGFVEVVEEGRSEHITGRDREAARSLRDGGLLDEVSQLKNSPFGLRLGNAVANDLRSRHLLERNDRVRPGSLELIGHAPHDVRGSIQPNDRVTQRDDEGLIADQRPGAQYRVPESELASLSRIEVFEVLSL